MQGSLCRCSGRVGLLVASSPPAAPLRQGFAAATQGNGRRRRCLCKSSDGSHPVGISVTGAVSLKFAPCCLHHWACCLAAERSWLGAERRDMRATTPGGAPFERIPGSLRRTLWIPPVLQLGRPPPWSAVAVHRASDDPHRPPVYSVLLRNSVAVYFRPADALSRCPLSLCTASRYPGARAIPG